MEISRAAMALSAIIRSGTADPRVTSRARGPVSGEARLLRAATISRSERRLVVTVTCSMSSLADNTSSGPHCRAPPSVAWRLNIEADGAARASDPALVKAVARGHTWLDDLVTSRVKSVNEIAAREGLTPPLRRPAARPRVPTTEAGRGGGQPVDMTAEQLTRTERG